MSEIVKALVYTGPHWMDALTPQQVKDRAAAHAHFQEKYDARSQEGDVVCVYREEEAAGEPVAPGRPFKIVHLPHLALKDAKVLEESLLDGDVLKAKRKHRIDLAGTSEVDGKIALTEAEFGARKTTKTVAAVAPR